MHFNSDDRQVVVDAKLFGILMSYAKDGVREASLEDELQVKAIERHAVKFNRHVRNDILLALQPGFMLQQKQEYARDVRRGASCTGTKAYLLMTNDCGREEYYLPVTIMGRSALSDSKMRLVIVRPYRINLEQEQAFSQNRRTNGGILRAGAKIKLAHHPITGPTLLHACFANDHTGWIDNLGVISLAAFPSHLKLSPPEGSYECHGGIFDGCWRAPNFLSEVNQ